MANFYQNVAVYFKNIFIPSPKGAILGQKLTPKFKISSNYFCYPSKRVIFSRLWGQNFNFIEKIFPTLIQGHEN